MNANELLLERPHTEATRSHFPIAYTTAMIARNGIMIPRATPPAPETKTPHLAMRGQLENRLVWKSSLLETETYQRDLTGS